MGSIFLSIYSVSDPGIFRNISHTFGLGLGFRVKVRVRIFMMSLNVPCRV